MPILCRTSAASGRASEPRACHGVQYGREIHGSGTPVDRRAWRRSENGCNVTDHLRRGRAARTRSRADRGCSVRSSDGPFRLECSRRAASSELERRVVPVTASAFAAAVRPPAGQCCRLALRARQRAAGVAPAHGSRPSWWTGHRPRRTARLGQSRLGADSGGAAHRPRVRPVGCASKRLAPPVRRKARRSGPSCASVVALDS